MGKTQMGMQLAVNVQIPAELNGIGGECIYIGACTVFFVAFAASAASTDALCRHRRKLQI